MGKYFKILLITLILPIFSGCSVAVATVAVGGGLTFLAFSGYVSDIENLEVALVVEKMASVIEKKKGEVTDISFTDGLITAKIGKSTVRINIERQEGAEVTIVVRAWKYFLPNTRLAEELLADYKGYK